MINKENRVLTLNDRMGKIALHTVGGKDAVLRVRLLPTGELETLGRIYGGAWDHNSVTACQRFLNAIKAHLTKRGEFGYFYIEERNLSIVNKRYKNSTC